MASSVHAADKSFVLATTTSTENSGLLDTIIPQFTLKTGIKVKVVAIGTGQALAMGRNGDAAALLTHDRLGEDKFVAEGYGKDRRDVMYNDFIFIGPSDDPAGLKDAQTTTDAFKALAQGGSTFISRGDDSGTHRKELREWKKAGFDVANFGSWYREAGSGMGQTIITTTQINGYTLSDRATWTKFARKADHVIVFEGNPPINNPYSSIVVTNKLIPNEETQYALSWHEWLTGAEGRKAIKDFRIDGQQMFFLGTD
ncbi:substrate-binding domain-containing protein [Ahrensia sp. 13_GOM-1096m]|uniref:substrate-binding domain-containing protein n=1 Tax=Ahrensia sp. 13_GOM-1096m TaxID=1380380 RepID=UPI0004786E48|nr:substrate-binding domain-containing protein [Ahrensia sp. 13_GOM-1096m]